MAIIRFWDRPFTHNPWTDFEKMRREMERFARGFSREAGPQSRATVYPATNITEDDETIIVRSEVPGVSPEELNISVEGETLTIQGERRSCIIDKQHSYHRREIDCGTFSRAIPLPSRINIDTVQAIIKDGIITVVLPKADEVKPKQISVSVG
ncbi:Hsp20/alpha crystallin family protein [Thermodesulfobacteriota bacterium]